MREEMKVLTVALLILIGFATYNMFDWFSARGSDKALVLMGIPTISYNSVTLNVKNFGDTPAQFLNASVFVGGEEIMASCISSRVADPGSTTQVIITFERDLASAVSGGCQGHLETDKGVLNFTARLP